MAEVAWIPADVLADDAVRRRSAAHTRSARPQRQAADALAAGVRRRGARRCSSTRRSPPTSSTRPRPATRCADLLEKYTDVRPAADDAAGSGQLDFDGTSLDDAELAARDALGGQPPRRRRSWRAWRPRAWPSCTARSRTRWCGCSRRWSTSASAVDVDELRALNERLTAEVQRCRPSCSEVGRPTVQPQLADPAARDPLHRARAGPGQEDQDRLLHRRGDAGEAQRPVARVHRSAAAVPRGREAPRHLRRRAARRGRRRRPHPRHVQPDGGAHRPALAPTSRTCTTSRCAARRAASSARRSSPRPGTSCSSPTTTRSSCAASPTSPRTRV